jgi:hypothetical protein
MTGGVFLFSAKVTVLELKNLDHPRTFRIRISPPERFFLRYIHSMYDEPVTEEFEIQKQEIILKGVRTGHAGVMEYYGFDQVKLFHAMDKRLAQPLIIKRAMRKGQALIIKDRTIYLSGLGEKGDRIQLSVYALPLGSYGLSMFLNEG